MAKQGCEKLGLESFDALVRRARTCRRFDESMRVPREFLLELAELAHLAPCGANAQRLRFHVVSDAEECSSLFEKLTWLVRSRIGRVLSRASARPAISRSLPSVPLRASLPRQLPSRRWYRRADDDARRPQRYARGGGVHVQAFPPRAIDVMGLDGDKYEVKLIMVFGVPAETQVIDAIDSNPDGSINYWRDEAQVHHVPKRPLADVLV